MKRTFNLILLILISAVSIAQTVPTAAPTVTYTSKQDSETKTVASGESFSEEAPLHIDCNANMSNETGFDVIYEWRLGKVVDKKLNLLIRRNDKDTSFEITETGTFQVNFGYTYYLDGVKCDVNDDSISFTIPESSLTCPDGISPNNDDANDYLIVTCKSIVKLQAMIFNRWGKKVSQCDLQQAQNHEKSTGNELVVWDGYIGGKAAKDGVYFINLVAEGSDGVVYKIKKAINVLKGYTSDQETDGTTE